jgi:hypothetical protein
MDYWLTSLYLTCQHVLDQQQHFLLVQVLEEVTVNTFGVV